MQINRRSFMKSCAAFSISTSLFNAAAMGKKLKPSKPNIIYIMLDDAGYGDFSPFGSQHIKTPAMELMCKEGMKFTDHYSGSCVCAPTRCVLMTGLHTGHCRRRDNQAKANTENADVPERRLVFLKPEDKTVAQSLQKAGYVTGGIGKWGLGNPGTTAEPEKMGFDHWYGYLDQVHAHDHYTSEIWQDGKMIPVPGNKKKKKETYLHYLFEDETMKFIKRYKNKPFFLYLAYTLPHSAYVIPHDDPAYQPFKDKPWDQGVKNYAAMVLRSDHTVSKILALLKKLGIDDNTIVFYTSDNGPNSQFLKDLNSAGGLKGIKRRLYEGGIRAPMAVRWPGKVPAGKTSSFQWGMRDVFPTLCDIASTPIPKGLDGMSVLPTLLGKQQRQRDHLYWEFYSPFQQAVRMGNLKAIRFATQGPVELYNLATDIGETNNIADKHPDIVTKVKKIMDESHVDTSFWPTVENLKKPKTKK